MTRWELVTSDEYITTILECIVTSRRPVKETRADAAQFMIQLKAELLHGDQGSSGCGNKKCKICYAQQPPKKTIRGLGRYYGYPKCCIEWFNNERMNFAPLTARQEKVHGDTGFIPCPDCAKLVTKKTLHTLIKDRKCRKAFPDE